MFCVTATIAVVISALFFGASSQLCEKNSYLPKGLVCKLDIFIRSEGQTDSNLSVPLGSSFLIVNGQDYSRKLRGINLAVFDLMTGRYMTGDVFDVKGSSAEGTRLRDVLQNLPNNVIILMAVQGTGNFNTNLNDAVSAMTDVGVNNTAILHNESFAAILYKGSGSQSWIKEAKNIAGYGPSFAAVTVPVPYGYIPEESIRTPFFNVAGSKFGGYCIKSSTQLDANSECAKALDGSTTSEWVTNTEGVGAWISIGFASEYKINKVRILQRNLSAAQSKDVRIDFSDCSPVVVGLTRDKGDFEEFTFSPRIASWVKLTVTSTHTSASNGFKEVQFYYDQYQSDTACDHVNLTAGSTSKAYRLLVSSMALQISSQKPVIILSTTTNPAGPRYEVILDVTASNLTYIKRSHDGSTVKQLAVSVARIPVLSTGIVAHVWLDWKQGRLIVGTGEHVISYYRDEQPLAVKYMFLQSPSSNAIFKVCGRKDYVYRSAMHYWPLDKVIGGSLSDLNGFKRGTLYGPYETTAAQGNTEGFSFVATQFDGTSNWVDFGDFKDSCVSDVDSCFEGLTVMVRVNHQGSGGSYVLSSGGQYTRGIAIYYQNSTTLRVEVRDSETRWIVDNSVGSEHLQIGFSWSKNLGLTVVTGITSFISKRNSIGEMLSSPVDESSHLILGRPNNETANYFHGTIDNLVIFYHSMTSDSLASLLRGTGMSGYTDSCFQDNSVSPSLLYYPGDIDPEVLSPNVCKEHCGNAYYTKAVIQDGSFCTCVNVTSSFVSVGNDLCFVPCTGNAGRKCGGVPSIVHVLDAIKATTSIVCTIPAKQEALTEFTATVQISKTFNTLVKNYLEVGDGSLNEKQYSPYQHTFVAVANFTTNPKAVFKNNETGELLTIGCPNTVESFLPTKGISFTCPKYVPTKTDFKCNISFTQGYDVDVLVTWSASDPAVTLRLPNSMLVSLGPAYSASVPPVNQTGPGMYVFPNIVNNHQGTFVGFQLDVISEGYLEIKCLAVVCENTSQQFCPSQRACVSQNTICEPGMIKCPVGSTLGMSSGSCLPGNSDSLYTPTTSSSNYNYRSKFNYVAWVNHGQRSLITLNNTVDVSECHFFGLAISSVSPAVVMATGYAYKSTLFYSQSAITAASSNNDTFIGLHTPEQANGPQVVDSIPKFQFKVIPYVMEEAVHIYALPGAYDASAAASSVGYSATNVIHAQDVVANISLSSIPAYPTQEAANVSLAPHLGTDVTYTWVFNDTNVTTSSPWVMYTCFSNGIHSVSVFARNNVSVCYSECPIECQETITGLTFTVNGLPTSAEKVPTQISWSLRNGSKVDFKIDPGDGSGERVLNDSKVSGAIFVSTLNITFEKAGVYNVTVTACNKLGNVTIHGLITMQESIVNVTTNAPECTTTKQSVNITASTQHGNMMRYTWTIDNQTYKTGEDQSLIFIPDRAGIYNMTLVVYNNVSTGLYRCQYIQAKDGVGGVEIGLVQPAGIGQPLSIPYTINNGSDFRISICYGDGICIDKNGTESAEGIAVYSSVFIHNYAKDADYVANLTVCNCASCNSTLIKVHVETPVKGPKMVVSKSGSPSSQSNACSAPLYVKVNATVFMVLNVVNGTNVKVIWDYGDSSNSNQSSLGSFDENGMHSNHSYNKAGNYTITVKAYNLNGHEVFTCHIVAQDPITGLAFNSNSPVGIPDGLVTMNTVPTGPTPSDPIHCVFKYGDTGSSVALPMSIADKQIVESTHNYPFKGRFGGSVNCSNQVSSFVQPFEVELQDKVKGSITKAYGTVPQRNISLDGSGYNGPDKQGTIFGRETDINFLTNCSAGSNLTCLFCFDCNGKEQVIKHSSCNKITHRFATSGIKQVNVTVKNNVSSETINIQLEIDDTINCAKLVNDGPKTVGNSHLFDVTLQGVGSNYCCLIKYENSTKSDLFVEESSSCSNLNFSVNILNFKNNTFRANHTVGNNIGAYSVSLYCVNRVSECKEEDKAVLVNIPCEQPEVSIMDFSLQSASATKRMRSEELIIRSRNKVDCKASLTRIFKWEIFNTHTSLDIPLNPNDTNMESLTIPPRKLEIGVYKVCFMLEMTDLIGIKGSTCSYLSILASPIIAEVFGGTEVAVGYNKTRYLNGLHSKDPDTGLKASNDASQLTCYWFCKRAEDNYTRPSSVDPDNLTAVPYRQILGNSSYDRKNLGGCFGHGPGRLNGSDCNLKVFTGKMQENTTYDFRLCVVHRDGRQKCADQRWNIKAGDPPSMVVECHSNCKDKVNPSGKVSLSCYCDNCNSADQVYFKWEISKKIPGSSEYNNFPIDEVKKLITTPINGRSFTIAPNKLPGREDFRFTCKANRGSKGAEGFAYFDREINGEPRSGTCDVTPKTGITLNTTFEILCSGWQDKDLPLSYTFGTAQDCQSEMTILASDRRESTYKVKSMLAGPKDNNYTTYVRVHVADKLLAVNTSTCIPLQVREQEFTTANLANLMNGTVQNLLASGSTNEVNQLVSSVLSQLKKDSSSSSSGDVPVDGTTPKPTKSPAELEKEKKEKTKITSQILSTLSTLAKSVTDIKSMVQLMNNVEKAVNPQFTNENATNQAADTIHSIVLKLRKKSKNAQPQEVEQGVYAAFQGIGKVAAYAADTTPKATQKESPTEVAGAVADNDEMDYQPPEPMSKELKKNNKALSNTITKSIEGMVEALIETKQAGENLTVFSTPTMDLAISRERRQDLQNKSFSLNGVDMQTNPEMFAGDQDLGGGKEPTPINFMLMASQKNFYNYDESVYLVAGGGVATIEFKNSSTGKAMVMQNLKTPCEMFVVRVSSPEKPVVNVMSTSSWSFLKMNITFNDTAIHVNVYPDNCDYGFDVFIKRGSRPSASNYDHNYSLPHDGKWDFGSNCSKSSHLSSAFRIFLSNKDLNHTAAGLYYIGIKFKPRNGTKNLEILPANFTAELFTSACMYWECTSERWESRGCVVGPKSNKKQLQCFCNHFTSFSSSFMVPPNKIDWNKIKNFDISEAYVCLTTVLGAFLLYFIFLILARRADRRDAEKTGVSPLPDNDPRDNYCYEVHVHTGFMRGAGTSAEISVVMNGSVGESDPRVLEDTGRKTFRTGGVDAFLMTVPQSLGSIRNIRIWHNNGGNYPSWNLLRVMIQDLQSEQRWWFVSDKWLAVDEGDGKIERILYPATSNELTKFNVLFATEVRKNLTDGHLWFSVVTRPARSTFTRVQRLTCCLSILLCTMLANIMFYNADTASGPKGTINIAGFVFSLAQVSIGITSSLIVFPSNLIVVQLFRKARAKHTTMAISTYEAKTDIDEVDVEKGKEKEKHKKEGLPHWFVYVAYALALGSSLASGVFVIFYGATYGEEKSAKWLMSMTISFVQDVLISQPIKVFLLASIFAILIKDPNKAESDPLTDANKLSTDEEWLHKNVKDLNDDEKQNFKKLIMDRPPDEAKLEIARQLRMKERHMASIIKEIVWYMFFLLIVLTVSYGNRDPETYRVTKYMNDIFLHSRYSGNMTFNKVKKISDFWKWVNETLVPSIYKKKWYNDHKPYPLGFLADTPTDLVLAVARLRQLRIKKDSCSHLRIFHHMIPECNDFYSPEEEDRRDLLIGWKEPSPTNTTALPPQPTKTAWDYQTGEELKTFPYWGYKATYDAGGYVKELPTNQYPNGAQAHAAMEELRHNNWLDRYTRAIFTELSIYNANTNFFCVITLLYEQLPTGGLANYPSILTLKLYRYVGGDMYFVLSCEILYLIFTLYFIFREIKMVKKEGLVHFKNPWSLVEVFVTMLSLALVVLYFVRMKFTNSAVQAMREDHSAFVSFNYTAFLDEWINATMGLIVFLSFLKIIRLLRFNRRLSLLAQTLNVCFPKIFAFMVIYGMAFFAYSQFACLVFGQSMEGFGTILRSAATLMDTILGKFALKELTYANRLIGPIFFYFYTVTMVFILINMFLSIINESFTEVKNDVNKQPNEYEIVNFMVHRLKENIGKTIGNAIMPIYKEPKSKLEKDFDAIEEHADSIMHYMRNMTFENMRHTRWFDAETSKEKKQKMFEILLEDDCDYFEDELGDSIPVFEEFLNKYDEKRLEDVHQAYRYKKMREQEMESKLTLRDSDLEEEEEEDSSEDSDSDNPSGTSDTNNDEKPIDLLGAPKDDNQSRTMPSPAPSIRSMYASARGPQTPILLHSPRPTRSPAHTPELSKPPQASETELSEVLHDVERNRCATDAELNSFLPEVKSLDDNNIPKYESDPEQITKKSKKKKKSKKLTSAKSTVSIKSKAAWGENANEVSRKSPEGSSDKDRIIPDGEEKETNDLAQDNKGFQYDIPSSSKPKRKQNRKKEKRISLSDNLEDESID